MTPGDWIKLRNETGSLENHKYHHGPDPAIVDTRESHRFFEKHSAKTLIQLCD